MSVRKLHPFLYKVKSIRRNESYLIVLLAKVLRLIKVYYVPITMKVRSSWGDSLSFEIRSGVRQEYALAYPPKLHYRLDPRQSLARLLKGSG